MLSHNRPAPLLLRPHSNTPPCLPLGALTAGRQDAAPHRQRGARLLRHHAHPRLHRNLPEVVMAAACAALLSIVWRPGGGCPPHPTATATCLLLSPPPLVPRQHSLIYCSPSLTLRLPPSSPDFTHSLHNNTSLAAVNCDVDARGSCAQNHSLARHRLFFMQDCWLPLCHQPGGCAAPGLHSGVGGALEAPSSHRRLDQQVGVLL